MSHHVATRRLSSDTRIRRSSFRDSFDPRLDEKRREDRKRGRKRDGDRERKRDEEERYARQDTVRKKSLVIGRDVMLSDDGDDDDIPCRVRMTVDRIRDGERRTRRPGHRQDTMARPLRRH